MNILLCLLIVGSVSITIPLTSNRKRCMITYSVGEAQTIKLDMKFPQIPNSQKGYTISWMNTETEKVDYELFSSGKYRKELELDLHVIYEICFWFESSVQIEVNVEYAAQSLFHLKQQQVKIPDNLLKVDDLRNTFISAQELVKITESFKQLQKSRAVQQNTIFQDTNNINSSLITLSAIQLAIIILAGLYQFWTLRKYLVEKQYL